MSWDWTEGVGGANAVGVLKSRPPVMPIAITKFCGIPSNHNSMSASEVVHSSELQEYIYNLHN